MNFNMFLCYIMLLVMHKIKKSQKKSRCVRHNNPTVCNRRWKKDHLKGKCEMNNTALLSNNKHFSHNMTFSSAYYFGIYQNDDAIQKNKHFKATFSLFKHNTWLFVKIRWLTRLSLAPIVKFSLFGLFDSWNRWILRVCSGTVAFPQLFGFGFGSLCDFQGSSGQCFSFHSRKQKL